MTRLALLAVASLAAVSALARTPQWPAQRTVIESDPLKVTARIPEGWSVDGGTIVPPVALRSACQVHRAWVRDDWNKALAAVIRDSAPDWRQLQRVGGHVAVNMRTTKGSRTTESVYINLDDIQPGTFTAWSVDADNTADGRECTLEFIGVLVQSLAIDK